MKFTVEHTDTFGGQANYNWVNQYELDLPEDVSDRVLVRRAKAVAGLTGVACRREEWGETVALFPYGSCTVLFITPNL